MMTILSKIKQALNSELGDAIVYAGLGAMITLNARDVGGVLLVVAAATAAYRFYKVINKK